VREKEMTGRILYDHEQGDLAELGNETIPETTNTKEEEGEAGRTARESKRREEREHGRMGSEKSQSW